MSTSPSSSGNDGEEEDLWEEFLEEASLAVQCAAGQHVFLWGTSGDDDCGQRAGERSCDRGSCLYGGCP